MNHFCAVGRDLSFFTAMVHLEQGPKSKSVFVGKIFLEINGLDLNGDLVLSWKPSVVLM